MKVLTATNQTQGRRENDFCWTVEGELVFFPPIECDRGSVDDDCGCRRSMAGLVSHQATTTMKVVDREELDRDTYMTLITDGLMAQGYVTKKLLRSRDVDEWVRDLVNDLVTTAGAFEAGTVLERRGPFVFMRQSLNNQSA
jgi:hypothetical protein